jgi:hypothetical protein
MKSNNSIPIQRVVVPGYAVGENGFISGTWIGITSIPGRTLLAHVMFDNGFLYSRLPVNFLRSTTATKHALASEVQPWDAFSYEIEVIRFPFLRDQVARNVNDKIGNWKGRYLFTIDSFDSNGMHPLAEHVEQHKTFNVFDCDDGLFRFLPNNFIQWDCPALYDEFDLKLQNQVNVIRGEQ